MKNQTVFCVIPYKLELTASADAYTSSQCDLWSLYLLPSRGRLISKGFPLREAPPYDEIMATISTRDPSVATLPRG